MMKKILSALVLLVFTAVLSFGQVAISPSDNSSQKGSISLSNSNQQLIATSYVNPATITNYGDGYGLMEVAGGAMLVFLIVACVASTIAIITAPFWL